MGKNNGLVTAGWEQVGEICEIVSIA